MTKTTGNTCREEAIKLLKIFKDSICYDPCPIPLLKTEKSDTLIDQLIAYLEKEK